jgi:hypothetical protein
MLKQQNKRRSGFARFFAEIHAGYCEGQKVARRYRTLSRLPNRELHQRRLPHSGISQAALAGGL